MSESKIIKTNKKKSVGNFKEADGNSYIDISSRKSLRIKNWENRKKYLATDNGLDIKFYNNEWHFNTSLKTNHFMVAPVTKHPPLFILHDDVRVIKNALKELFDRFQQNEFNKYFNAITLRVDRRFSVYPFVLANDRIIAFIETGIGSGSTNFVMENLAAIHTKFVLKLGTCSALEKTIKANTVLFVEEALADEGASQYTFDYMPDLTKLTTYSPFGDKTSKLRENFIKNNRGKYNLIKSSVPSRVVSTDAYESFDMSTDLYPLWQARGILGVEMECSNFFSNSQKFKIPALALLTVSRTTDTLLNKFSTPYAPSVDKEAVVATQVQLIFDVLTDSAIWEIGFNAD